MAHWQQNQNYFMILSKEMAKSASKTKTVNWRHTVRKELECARTKKGETELIANNRVQ